MSGKKTILTVFFLLAILIVGQHFGLTGIEQSGKVNTGTPLPQAGGGLARFFQHPEGLLPGTKQDGTTTQSDESLGVTRAKNQIAIPEKSPEELPANVQEIRKKLYAKPIADHNGDLLLAQTDAWIIEYIPTPQLFLVTIRKDPADTAKKDAERWFLDAGLKQEDLCDLPVRFLLGSEELRRTNINFTSLPNGCEPR